MWLDCGMSMVGDIQGRVNEWDRDSMKDERNHVLWVVLRNVMTQPLKHKENKVDLKR